MKFRIRRILAHLAVGALVAATCTLVTATAPAQAFGGEVLNCRVSPGPAIAYMNPCWNRRGAATYNAGFLLQNMSGSGYTFSWSWSGGPVIGIVAGCTSADYGCGLRVANGDTHVTATVTYSQDGQTAARTATAYIIAYCGTVPC